jgi:hypothetical protein
MVRAIQDGSRTQTRRIYKNRKHPDAGCDMAACELVREVQHVIDRICPYGQPGDHLWVRETWQGPLFDDMDAYRAGPDDFNKPKFCEYAADGGPAPKFMTMDDELVCRWRPSIHMPRWASRINLEITGVRVERLQDIGERDSLAEGVTIEHHHSWGYCAGEFLPPAMRAYRDLRKSINRPGSWDANPWVWVVEFRRVA